MCITNKTSHTVKSVPTLKMNNTLIKENRNIEIFLSIFIKIVHGGSKMSVKNFTNKTL